MADEDFAVLEQYVTELPLENSEVSTTPTSEELVKKVQRLAQRDFKKFF